jgi:hypothetical protein
MKQRTKNALQLAVFFPLGLIAIALAAGSGMRAYRRIEEMDCKELRVRQLEREHEQDVQNRLIDERHRLMDERHRLMDEQIRSLQDEIKKLDREVTGSIQPN